MINSSSTCIILLRATMTAMSAWRKQPVRVRTGKEIRPVFTEMKRQFENVEWLALMPTTTSNEIVFIENNIRL